MPTFSVRYFALLREKAGAENEEVTGEFKNLSDLYQNLNLKYQFGLEASMIQVAVNDEFAQMSDEVIQGAKIVFIPPVAGG